MTQTEFDKLAAGLWIARDFNRAQELENRIIAMVAEGESVVPMILAKVKSKGEFYWFHILREITGYDPVPKGDYMRNGDLRRAWLRWGKEKGLL